MIYLGNYHRSFNRRIESFQETKRTEDFGNRSKPCYLKKISKQGPSITRQTMKSLKEDKNIQ